MLTRPLVAYLMEELPATRFVGAGGLLKGLRVVPSWNRDIDFGVADLYGLRGAESELTAIAARREHERLLLGVHLPYSPNAASGGNDQPRF